MPGKTGVSVRIVRNDLPGMSAEIETAIKAEVAKTAYRIEADAKAKAPYITGTLRRSITTQIGNGGLRAIVAAGTDYAIYVEHGTGRTPARPFLIPAAEKHLPQFVATVKSLLRGLK